MKRRGAWKALAGPGGVSSPPQPRCPAGSGHPGVVQRQNQQLPATGRREEEAEERGQRPGSPPGPSSAPLPRTTKATSACRSQQQRGAQGSAPCGAPVNQHILPSPLMLQIIHQFPRVSACFLRFEQPLYLLFLFSWEDEE